MTSFVPINVANTNTSLYGAAIPKTEDIYEELDPKRADERFAERHDKSDNTNGNKPNNATYKLILAIIITIILFVTGIAFYDIIKSRISNHYSREALENVESDNSEEDIRRTEIANNAVYNANIAFFITCLIIDVITLPVLLYSYSLL